METRNLPLRILYTINSSPQYILARSISLVPIVLVSQAHSHSPGTSTNLETHFHHATVSLRTCLDSICRSSPELVQDFTRDFSVYVLDPLESNSAPAPVSIADPTSRTSPVTAQTPRGVAVGLGLMSWALLADESDSVPVTGTLIRLATGQEALEVIFALRETATMQKSSLPAALRSWGLPPQPSSTLSRTLASKSRHEPEKPRKSLIQVSNPIPPNQNDFESGGSSSVRLVHQNSSNISSPSRQHLYQVSESANVTTLATIASIQMRAHHRRPKPKKSLKPFTSIYTNSEADRLMLAEDVYIGPVRKKGRPLGTSGTKDGDVDGETNNSSGPTVLEEDVNPEVLPTGIINPEETASNSLSSAGPNHLNLSASESKTKPKPTKKSLSQEYSPLPFVNTPLVRPPRDPNTPFPHNSSEPMTLLDILAYLSASSSSSDPNIQNAALLAALNAIDSRAIVPGPSSESDKSSNPALVTALKDLLSAVSKQRPASNVSATCTSQVFNSHGSHSPDDEVVLLNKENVNPGAFRRRAERDAKPISTPFSGFGHVSTVASNQKASHNRSLSTRSDENSNISASLSNSCMTINRKRTLSEFMEEKEAGADKGKAREREWIERRDAHRHAHSSSANRSDISANRHYSRIFNYDVPHHKKSGTNSYYRTGMEPWTSPTRPRMENPAPDVSSQQQFTTISDSSPPKVSASSPIRSKSAHSRRPFVLPEWARTETSTQPRLSQEAQKALDDAGERKKREKKEAARRKIIHRGEGKKQLTKSLSPIKPVNGDIPNSDKSMEIPVAPQPVAASSDYPLFTITSAMQHQISTPSPSVSRHGSPYPRPFTTNENPPTTPPPKQSEDPYNLDEGGSLFTPMSSSRDLIALGSVVSPLYPRNGLALSYKSKAMGAMTSPVTKEKSSSAKEEYIDPEGSRDTEDTLSQELHSAFEDMDRPTTGNDIHANEEISSTLDGTQLCGEDGDSEPPTLTMKQHWMGLPPSSPPPPTSPPLMPHDEESDSFSDDLELPIATSDIEDSSLDTEVISAPPPMTDSTIYTDEKLTEYFNDDNFASLFSGIVGQSVLGSDTEKPGVAICDQFINTQSDPGDQNMGSTQDTCLDILPADFDFTEFWETFKPLVQHHTSGIDNHDPYLDTDMKFGQVGNVQVLGAMKELDHAKLAEDVQALFSGCLM